MSAYYEFKLPAKILSGDGALEHIPPRAGQPGGTAPPCSATRAWSRWGR